MRPTSVFVGELTEDTQKEGLEREFNKYGILSKVWVARNPPGFTFIEFEDDQDARETIKEMNGTMLNGNEIRVYLSRNGRRDGDRGGGRGGQGGGGYRGGRGGYDSNFRGGGSYGRVSYGSSDYGSSYCSRSPMGRDG